MKKHAMDNKWCEKIKELIESEYVLELDSPGCHRRELAERGINIFKNHFLSILLGVDDSCPVYL